jgi:Domain of unknown function (DUF4082)
MSYFALSCALGALYDLGVKSCSDRHRTVTPACLFKSANKTSIRIARLANSSGTLLSPATFTDASPAGWQQANLPMPKPVHANTAYTASSRNPNGNSRSNHECFVSQHNKPRLPRLEIIAHHLFFIWRNTPTAEGFFPRAILSLEIA